MLTTPKPQTCSNSASQRGTNPDSKPITSITMRRNETPNLLGNENIHHHHHHHHHHHDPHRRHNRVSTEASKTGLGFENTLPILGASLLKPTKTLLLKPPSKPCDDRIPSEVPISPRCCSKRGPGSYCVRVSFPLRQTVSGVHASRPFPYEPWAKNGLGLTPTLRVAAPPGCWHQGLVKVSKVCMYCV